MLSSESCEVLFSRYEHGGHPVRVVVPPRSGVRGEFEILSPSGNIRARYTSAKNLIAALTGTPRHGLGFEQYFGIDRSSPAYRVPRGGSVLDLFAPRPVEEIPPVQAPTPSITIISSRSGLGIDLSKRGNEVRKLLFAGFGSRINRSGYDPDEVLQEVYRGLLARNRGKCPFDATKSSFGHYVHMVCECILNNYHRRESRRREVEQVGMNAPMSLQDDAGTSGMVDASTVAEHMVGSSSDSCGDMDMNEALRRLTRHVDRKRSSGIQVDVISVKVAEMLVTGKNRREIASEIGVSQTRVASAIHALREHVSDWA